jgi:hypothetical protein
VEFLCKLILIQLYLIGGFVSTARAFRGASLRSRATTLGNGTILALVGVLLR